jgi:molybdenum ABC transporter molybdate-binding protein
VKIYRVSIITVLGFILLFGCINKSSDNAEPVPDLVVYCENGILNPVREFTEYFEEKTGLSVAIYNDNARNLINQIHYRRDADIFIPDSRYALDNIRLASPDIVTDSVSLGYQTLVFIVLKGNPKNFDGTLASLTNPEYGVILANPESSTLGMVTGVMLSHYELFDPVMNSVLFLTSDSRGLIRNIDNNQASIAINWNSCIVNRDGNFTIEVIPIQAKYTHHQAIAVILNNAPHKENAAQYLKMLNSGAAKIIMQKYGIDKEVLSSK